MYGLFLQICAITQLGEWLSHLLNPLNKNFGVLDVLSGTCWSTVSSIRMAKCRRGTVPSFPRSTVLTSESNTDNIQQDLYVSRCQLQLQLKLVHSGFYVAVLLRLLILQRSTYRRVTLHRWTCHPLVELQKTIWHRKMMTNMTFKLNLARPLRTPRECAHSTADPREHVGEC